MLPELQAKGAWAARTGPFGERQAERGRSETQRGLRLHALGAPCPCQPGASQARPSPIMSLHEVPRLLGAILEETGQQLGSAPESEEALGTHCSVSSQENQPWPRAPGTQEVQWVGRGGPGQPGAPQE